MQLYSRTSRMALVVLSLLAAALCLSTYRSRLVWPRWHPGVGLPPPDLSMEPQTAAEQRWRFNMRRYNTTDVDPQAVCNDGSPGVFFFRPALSMHSTKWVVRFHGGAWCWDKLSCEQRWRDSPHLMSTTMLPPDAVNETCPVRDIQLHGIMSMHPEENPAFYGWNQVYVWYCSSDSHLGDAPEGFTDETGEWHFRGKRITAAVFTTLLQRENLAAATDVLVSGDSAGGVAALNNAAFIHDIVAPRAHGIQRFKAFIDAGWFLDVPNYSGNPGAFSFRKCAQSLVTNYNASFDRSCTAHFPDEPWRCFHAQYAWRHVKFPVLFHEFLYDSANLGFDTCYKQADVEDFRHRLVRSFDEPESWPGGDVERHSGPAAAAADVAAGRAGGAAPAAGPHVGAVAAEQEQAADSAVKDSAQNPKPRRAQEVGSMPRPVPIALPQLDPNWRSARFVRGATAKVDSGRVSGHKRGDTGSPSVQPSMPSIAAQSAVRTGSYDADDRDDGHALTLADSKQPSRRSMPVVQHSTQPAGDFDDYLDDPEMVPYQSAQSMQSSNPPKAAHRPAHWRRRGSRAQQPALVHKAVRSQDAAAAEALSDLMQRAIDTLPWSGDTGHVKISGSYKQRADTLRLVAEAEMETLSEGAWHGPQPRQAGTPGRAGRAGKARSAGAARRLLGESGGDDESDIVAEAVAADEEYHSMPSMPEGQSVPQHDASAAPLASHASEGPSGRSTAQHGTTADAEPATGSADTAPDTHALQIFAPACHLHEITDTNFFMASHIGGQFLFDVLTEWFYRDTGRPLQLVDQHSGIRDDRECLKALHQQPPSSKR